MPDSLGLSSDPAATEELEAGSVAGSGVERDGQEQEPEFSVLSQDDLRNLIREVVRESLEPHYRGVQSLSDKTVARLEQVVQQVALLGADNKRIGALLSTLGEKALDPADLLAVDQRLAAERERAELERLRERERVYSQMSQSQQSQAESAAAYFKDTVNPELQEFGQETYGITQKEYEELAATAFPKELPDYTEKSWSAYRRAAQKAMKAYAERKAEAASALAQSVDKKRQSVPSGRGTAPAGDRPVDSSFYLERHLRQFSQSG